MKRCGKCGETKPYTDFNKNKAKQDGHQGRCRDCQRSGERKHYADNDSRKERVRFSNWKAKSAAQMFLFKYLGEHPCVDCGEPDRVVLDLDHVRGVKEYDVSHMVARGFALERIKAEIAKCEVRCANCHRRVTAARSGNWARANGFGSTFVTWGDFPDEL
ncbi:HNH endonuclease [Mycobacterium phage Vetrix]|nr:HNH endonuclease [Mycobacterium phage Vetrix]